MEWSASPCRLDIQWAQILIFSQCAVVLLAAWVIYRVMRRDRSLPKSPICSEKVQNVDPYTAIEPLESVDWRTGRILQLRPFKPKYNLTMALSPCSLSEFLMVDSTYLDRIKLRRSLIEAEPDVMVGANSVALPAVQELYSWLVETYLPQRFPRMYTIERQGFEPGILRNQATGEAISLSPPSACQEALRVLGSHIDTDFLVLLPSEEQHQQDVTATPPELKKNQGYSPYILNAFVTCFPAGFSTRGKMSKTLADIHLPVPGYDKILRKSMDRFFATLPVGKIVQRANWFVTTGGTLTIHVGNHMSEEEYAAAKKAATFKQMTVEEVEANKDKIWMRSERQTLHRLPNTKALVFAFKTYVYPIEDIKTEGNAEAFAQAIEGMGAGNVPQMEVYKRSVVWGPALCEWLRMP